MFKETGTKATWANPTVVPVSQRQTGGWYYNPDTGSVDRWWNEGGTPSTTTPASSAFSSTGNYQDILGSVMASRAAGNEQAQKDYEAAQTKISGELGIPGMTSQLNTTRGEVGKVKDLLGQLESDINTRTSGQLLSESQRRRLLASEETPLRTQLANLTTGEQTTADQLEVAYQQLDRQLSPLLMRIQSNQQLSNDEWQLASQLAIQDRAFEQEKQKIKLNASVTSANSPTEEEFKALFGTNQGVNINANTPGLSFNSTSGKPTNKLGPVSAVSPDGKWAWDYFTGDWVPIVA